MTLASEQAHIPEDLIEAVWQKATIIPNNNPNEFRQDYAGAWIRRDEYGKASPYGWEIDHLLPLSKGGSDDIENLLPLQHQNYKRKGDNHPRWSTAVSAEGSDNVDFIRNWYVAQ